MTRTQERTKEKDWETRRPKLFVGLPQLTASALLVCPASNIAKRHAFDPCPLDFPLFSASARIPLSADDLDLAVHCLPVHRTPPPSTFTDAGSKTPTRRASFLLACPAVLHDPILTIFIIGSLAASHPATSTVTRTASQQQSIHLNALTPRDPSRQRRRTPPICPGELGPQHPTQHYLPEPIDQWPIDSTSW